MALLRRYVDLGSQDAFNQLVSRHLSWVHATCRKGLRDRHMAEDAAQAVFIILARRAASITPQTRLSGWLFNTARFVIKDAKKQETRYRRRENVAREMSVVPPDPRPGTRRRPDAGGTGRCAGDPDGARSPRAPDAFLRRPLAAGDGRRARNHQGRRRKARRPCPVSPADAHAHNGKSAAATVAILAVLLRSRAAEAAPLGMAQTVASSATVPGVATSVAKWMAQRAMSTSAGASRRLLRALVAFELVTAATLVTVRSLPAKRHVSMTSVAGTSVAQVQPATPATARSRSPVCADQVSHRRRGGAGDAVPIGRVRPRAARRAAAAVQGRAQADGPDLLGGRGFGPGGVVRRRGERVDLHGARLQRDSHVERGGAAAAATPDALTDGASGDAGSSLDCAGLGRRDGVGASAPTSETSAPSSSKTAKTPTAPDTEPPLAGGKGHTSWPATRRSPWRRRPPTNRGRARPAWTNGRTRATQRCRSRRRTGPRNPRSFTRSFPSAAARSSCSRPRRRAGSRLRLRRRIRSGPGPHPAGVHRRDVQPLRFHPRA